MGEQRILFTGGGTAGHVIVNTALIPYFHKAGWKIDYIGSISGIEKELIESFEYVTYHPVSTGKLRRYMSIENFKDPFKILKGIYESWQIIGKKRPQIIFSKGGFVSVPVSIAGWFRRVPTIIHESDFTPGLANKLATPFAKRVLTTFPETVNYLPLKKTTHVGAIVRKELITGTQEAGYKLTGLKKTKPILLIMGGSGGSRKINEIIRKNLSILLVNYQIIHICGDDGIDETIQKEGYVQYKYVKEELSDLFAITDYIISRAGSNAIFEFLALNIPMLLIPLSLGASRGDQIVNAKSFEKQGYAKVLEEEKLNNESLIKSLDELVLSSSVMVRKMKQNETEDSFNKVIEIIESTSKKTLTFIS